MKVEKNKMVKIHYTLKDEKGNVIDSSLDKEALEYLHGVGMLIPGMETALEGREKGEKFSAVIEPKDGYGEFNPDWVTEVPRDRFDGVTDIQVGQKFTADTPTGPIMVTVTKVEDDKITIDSNHELAGKTLYFDVEVVDVRDATPQETEPYESSGCSGSCSSCGGSCSSCGGSCGELSEDDL